MSSAPVEATVEPLSQPRCCKIPLITSIEGHGACRCWYDPNATASEVDQELEGDLLGLAKMEERVIA